MSTWILIIAFAVGSQIHTTHGPISFEHCMVVISNARAGKLPVIMDSGGAPTIKAVACAGPQGEWEEVIVEEVGS